MKKRIWSVLFVVFMAVIFLVSCKTTPDLPPELEIPTEPEEPYQISFAKKLQSLLEQGLYDEALNLFSVMPEEYDNDYSLNYLHASLLVSANKIDEASAVLAKLEQIDPDNVENLVLKSMIAKLTGDKAEKTKILKEIIAKDPGNTSANVELGNEQMFRKNFKLANKYYRKALETNPTHVEALFGYGQTSYYNDDLDTAEKAFKKILENDKRNALAWAYLGKLEGDKENYLKASQYVEEAIKIDPDYYDYWVDYGQFLYHQGKFEDAEKAWDKAVGLEPDNFLVYIYRSALYDETERFDLALSDYEKIIQLKPDYYFAYEAVGILAWHEKNYDKARNAFLMAYKYNPNNISYPLMVSATYLIQGNNIENRKFMGNVLRNRDIKSATYSVLRLFYDGVNPSAVDTKVKNEPSVMLKGKLLYYLGLFNEINGNDIIAKKYYTDVIKLQAPMFFEYRLAEWALEVE